MEIKQKLRKELKARVQELSKAYCRAADQEIARRLYELEEYKRAKTVFCYVGTPAEIDTVPILLHALAEGKQVGVPLCKGHGMMEVINITDLTDLTPGAFGIMEPKPGGRWMDPGEIGLALIPCLSCTRQGVRLGYGGGYYDRYLRYVPGFKLALCREKMLSEHLIQETHDIRMDGVLTENSAVILNHTN